MSNRGLEDDVNVIVKRPRIVKRPPTIRRAGIRPAQVFNVGVGLAVEDEGSSGGIDSPLTEVSRVSLGLTVYDATGLIAVSFNTAREVLMTDANEREVNFIYGA